MKKSKGVKLLLCCAVALGVSLFTSCSDNEKLTVGQAEDALEELPIFNEYRSVMEFETGFYEVGETEMTKLRQMRAAEIITCEFEKTSEKIRRYHNGGWYGRSYYYYQNEHHYFAKVELTKKGEKYVVELNEMFKGNAIDKIEHNLIKRYQEKERDSVPEYMSNYVVEHLISPEEQKDIELEETRKSAERALNQSKNVVQSSVDSTQNIVQQEENIMVQFNQEEEEDTEGSAMVEIPEKSSYELAKEKVSSKKVCVLLGRYKFVKAYAVQCTDEMLKEGKAKCKYVMKFTDKTPFCWILADIDNNKPIFKDAEFVYYEDLGWIPEEKVGIEELEQLQDILN